MSFSTRATVEFEPDDRSLRQLRSTVEDRVGGVSVNAQTDGGTNVTPPQSRSGRFGSMLGDVLNNLGSDQTSTDLLDEQKDANDILVQQLGVLEEINDNIEKQAFSGGSKKGGGLTTSIIGSLGVRAALGGIGGAALAGGAGLLGGSALLGNPAKEGTLTSRLGDMGAGLIGGEDFANKTGDQRRQQTYEQIRQATKDFTSSFNSTLTDLRNYEFPELPTLEAPSLPTLELPTLPKLQFQKPSWFSTIENFLSGGGNSGGNFGGSVLGPDGRPTAGGDGGLGNVNLSPNLNIDISLNDIRRQIEQAFRNINLEQIVENIVRNQFGSGF